MNGTDRFGRRGRVPRGVLGMLALVGLVESFIARSDLDFLGAENWNCRQSRQAAAKQARACDLLCFGDSLIKLGIAPRVIGARTGWTSYSLAICGSQTPMSYFLLRRALESGAKPTALLVSFSPPLLRLPPSHNHEQWPFLLSLRDAVDLCWTARDGSLFASIVLRKNLPSFRCRNAIRPVIVKALRGEGNPNRFSNVMFQRNWRRNDGAQIAASNPQLKDSGLDIDAWCRGYFPRWETHPINIHYLERFLRLAQAQELPIVWLLPPHWPSVSSRCEQSGFHADQTRFMRELQARYPALTILDGRHSNYDPTVFLDPNHLGREGAYAYSLAVSEVLRRHLPGSANAPRWLELPAYCQPPQDNPLEDVHQSALVLEGFKTRR